ncbi:hypothetical protein KOI82_23045, partial [Escherichia coli]
VIACIEDPIVIKQILDHLKHKAETSGTRALPESRAPPAELLLHLAFPYLPFIYFLLFCFLFL